jgi:hypothetical protein
MGWADMILGSSNPFAQWADSNPMVLSGIAGGLASGQNISAGLSNAVQAIGPAEQAQNAYKLSLADQQSRLGQIAYERSIQQAALQRQLAGMQSASDMAAQSSNPTLQSMAPILKNDPTAVTDLVGAMTKVTPVNQDQYLVNGLGTTTGNVPNTTPNPDGTLPPLGERFGPISFDQAGNGYQSTKFGGVAKVSSAPGSSSASSGAAAAPSSGSFWTNGGNVSGPAAAAAAVAPTPPSTRSQAPGNYVSGAGPVLVTPSQQAADTAAQTEVAKTAATLPYQQKIEQPTYESAALQERATLNQISQALPLAKGWLNVGGPGMILSSFHGNDAANLKTLLNGITESASVDAMNQSRIDANGGPIQRITQSEFGALAQAKQAVSQAQTSGQLVKALSNLANVTQQLQGIRQNAWQSIYGKLPPVISSMPDVYSQGMAIANPDVKSPAPLPIAGANAAAAAAGARPATAPPIVIPGKGTFVSDGQGGWVQQ